jgi:hypothetical protein
MGYFCHVMPPEVRKTRFPKHARTGDIDYDVNNMEGYEYHKALIPMIRLTVRRILW